MVDTARQLGALQTLYADNATQDISPQDLRDGVLSWHPEALGYFNVKASGAKGDDSTDDTAAIAAAAVLADANNGILFFPPGTYLTDEIVWSGQDFNILGVGQDKSIIKANAGNTGALITIDRNDNFGAEPQHFQHLTLQGNGNSGALLRGLFLDDANNVRCRWVTFKNFGGNCWRIDGVGGNSNHNYLQDCVLMPGPGYRTNDVAAIHLFGTTNSTIIENINFMTSAGLTPQLGVSGLVIVEQDPAAAAGAKGMPQDVRMSGFVGQALDVPTGGVLISLIDTTDVLLGDSKWWDTIFQTTGKAIIEIKIINDTNRYGGNHIRGLLGDKVDTGSWLYGVEIDSDWNSVHSPGAGNGPAVHLKSGATGNTIRLEGESERDSGGWVDGQVDDDSGNETNTYGDTFQDYVVGKPIVGSVPAAASSHKGGEAFLSTINKPIYNDGTDWRRQDTDAIVT